MQATTTRTGDWRLRATDGSTPDLTTREGLTEAIRRLKYYAHRPGEVRGLAALEDLLTGYMFPVETRWGDLPTVDDAMKAWDERYVRLHGEPKGAWQYEEYRGAVKAVFPLIKAAKGGA